MNIVTRLMRLAGLNTLFQQTIEPYETAYKDAMTFVSSTKSTEEYGWLGDVPQMAEEKGEPVPEGLLEFDYALKNKRHSARIDVFNDDLDDDQYGQTKVRIGDMATHAGAYPSILLAELLVNGTSKPCYDGQPFFSSTHKEGKSGDQSNLVAGTGVTVEQIRADFKAARKLMMTYKSDKGKAWKRMKPKFVVRCAPDLYVTMLEALMTPTVATGGQNVFKGLVDSVEEDQNLSGNDWYLEDRSPLVKAFILQEREKVTPKNTMPGSEADVVEDKTVYVVRWRGAAGYGQWRHCVKVDNS